MKLIFAGTPQIAATVLNDLLQSEHEIVAVYTQPDRPAGRGRKLAPSPVKQLALEHKLIVEQPENFKEDIAANKLASYQADAMIVLAYGLILPQKILDMPKYGCINIHASLLPRWRGAAPIQHAILAGDKETGVSIMQMNAGLDTGPTYEIVSCQITEKETAQSLHDKLAELAAPPLLNTLTKIENGSAVAVEQDSEQATYAHKILKIDAKIDWNLSAEKIARMIRAYNPWPIAFTELNNKRIRIWQAHALTVQHHDAPGLITEVGKDHIHVQTGEGVLEITQLQLPGKKAMPVKDILNSCRNLFIVGQPI